MFHPGKEPGYRCFLRWWTAMKKWSELATCGFPANTVERPRPVAGGLLWSGNVIEKVAPFW